MADKLDGGAIVANTIPGTKIQSGTITTTQLDPAIAAAVTVPLHPKISSLTYPGNDTAANTGGGDSIVINGSGFGTNVQVYINETAAPSVTRNNANAVTITTAAQSAGTYLVYLINTDDGGTAILVPGIQYSGMPTWVTSSPLTGQDAAVAWSISLSATGDTPITYALQAGSSLPDGITLAANGLISGTMTSPPAEDTTYNFTVVATDPQFQDTPKAFSVSVTVVVDTQFQYTTLLLQADGTNNGNNHAFLDSSNNNFTITRNGNATQGSFSPFSPTGWSGYFDGTGDRITFTNQSTTGNFTCECWFFATANTSGGYHILFGGSGTGGPTNTQLTARNDGTVGIALNDASVAISSSAPFSINTWNHIAWVRSGTTVAIFVNGIRAVTGTSSAALNVDRIGGQFSGYEPIGYISNARITTTAVYDPSLTTCTIPTAPFTAITGTYLLTLQDNRFIDRSASPLTLTRNGNVSIQSFSPFATTTAYSPATHGGSAFFDGTGDALTLPSNSALALGSGNFTVEAWVYNQSGLDLYPDIFSNSGSIIAFILNDRSSTYRTILSDDNYPGSGNVALLSASGTIGQNSWAHVAWVRSGSTITVYINGAASGTATSSTDHTREMQVIGAIAQGSGPNLYFWNGYISNLRIVKGAAVYTSNFTPPTTLLTNIANTSLLTNFTNAQIYDAAAGAVLECVGDAKVNTAIKKYGAGSITFDGNGDYLLTNAPSTETTNLGSGDFTVELWVYFNGVSSVQTFVDWRDASTVAAYPLLVLNSDATILWSHSNNTRITSSPISANTWYHVAVCRAGGQTKLFINGTQSGSTYSDSTTYLTTSGAPRIGIDRRAAPSYYFNGYIDDLRISKGLARYRYNFTPPTRAFATKGGTQTLTADEDFEYTTLLLPGNGTNNQNNHTFLDSSNNNFTITRNGNATQGTFSPFSQTGWSNYFDGTGDYLNAGSGTNNVALSGDFCIEAWIYRNANADGTIIGNYNSSPNRGWSFRSYSSNNLYMYFQIDGGSEITYTTSSATLPLQQWTHVVWCRSGTNASVYINGVRVDNRSLSGTSTGNGGLSISALSQSRGDINFNGYISNARVVNGSSVYDPSQALITVPITPLTSITNTSLLTCQSNRFVDNSNNAFAITRNGDVSVQAFSPFAPTASYATANVGGSAYFDGAGDYLTAAANSAYELNGDFTIEFWVKTATFDLNTYYRRLLCFGQDAANNPQLLFFDGSAATSNLSVYSNSLLIGGNIPVATDAWNHIALCRSGTSLRLFVNGVQSGSTATTSQNFNAGATNGIFIGRYALDGGYLSGYMSGLRILKGTALYTTTFTPPTAPLTNVANTSLLLNFTNAGITDATAKNILETVGDAKISTVQSKFGGSSMYFDGNGDNLSARDNELIQLASGDFTIECWVYPTANGALYDSGFVSYGAASALAGWFFGMSGTNTGGTLNRLIWSVNYAASGGAPVYATTGVPLNTWSHVAVSKYGTTISLFLNGSLDKTATVTATPTTSSSYKLYLGTASYDPTGTQRSLTGYMDDVRITKGIARYVQNFTPPTIAFLTR